MRLDHDAGSHLKVAQPTKLFPLSRIAALASFQLLGYAAAVNCKPPDQSATPADQKPEKTIGHSNISSAENLSKGRMTSRSVRSFVVRNGRMTPAQQRALDELLPLYGVEYQSAPIETQKIFGRQAPLWVETGFGNGDALLSMAQRYPEKNFLGIEVHAPGVGHLLQRIKTSEVDNIRVVRHDAVEVFDNMLAAESVERALVFFPDPWPKKRHHKRRILQTDFVTVIENALQPAGVIHCATDWQEYAEWILELLQTRDRLKNLTAANQYAERPDYRPATRFENRGRRLGHDVFDLLFEKVAA